MFSILHYTCTPLGANKKLKLGNNKSDGVDCFFSRASMLTFEFEVRTTSNGEAVLWMNTRGSTQIEFLRQPGRSLSGQNGRVRRNHGQNRALTNKQVRSISLKQSISRASTKAMLNMALKALRGHHTTPKQSGLNLFMQLYWTCIVTGLSLKASLAFKFVSISLPPIAICSWFLRLGCSWAPEFQILRPE